MCVWTTVWVFFRHKEAIKKWDEAIQLTPDNPDLYEMKSQVISLKPIFLFFIFFPYTTIIISTTLNFYFWVNLIGLLVSNLSLKELEEEE